MLFEPFTFDENNEINLIKIHGSVDLILRKDGKIENIITRDESSQELKEFMTFPPKSRRLNSNYQS